MNRNRLQVYLFSNLDQPLYHAPPRPRRARWLDGWGAKSYNREMMHEDFCGRVS